MGKKVNAIFLASSLLLGTISMPLLASCGGNEVEIDSQYSVFINLEEGVELDIKTSAENKPVETGTIVTITVSNLSVGKTCVITSEQVEVKKESATTFSFVMPSQNVYLNVNLENEVINQSSLDALKKGFKLETKVSETIDDVTKYSIVETQVVDGKFTVKTYEQSANENPSKEKPQLFETYYKNEKGELTAGRIGINNKFKYYPVLFPDGSGVITWDANGYKNFFSYLNIEHFKLGKDGWFNLKLNDESLKEAYKAIMTQLYGNPGLELDSFSLKVENGNIVALKAESKTFIGSSKNYKYQFESKITNVGEENFEERYKPFKNKEDAEFSKIFNELNKNNYTLTQTDYANGKVSGVTTLKANPDKVYYEVPDEVGDLVKIGYYVKDGFTQEVTQKDDGFYKVGEPMEGDITPELLVNYDINYSCFDKADNKYTLKKGIDASTSAFSMFMTTTETLDDVTIETIEGGYRVTNIYSKNKTIFDFTNIGSTDVGFSEETVKEQFVPTSWTELVDEATYTGLSEYFGEGFTSLPIPTFIGSQMINLAEEKGLGLLVFDGAPGETWVSTYADMLKEAGFEHQPGEDLFGAGNGEVFIKTFQVKGAEMTVGYQVCLLDGLFAIAFVDMAVAG